VQPQHVLVRDPIPRRPGLPSIAVDECALRARVSFCSAVSWMRSRNAATASTRAKSAGVMANRGR
jgi:hypothetical protein